MFQYGIEGWKNFDDSTYAYLLSMLILHLIGGRMIREREIFLMVITFTMTVIDIEVVLLDTGQIKILRF